MDGETAEREVSGEQARETPKQGFPGADAGPEAEMPPVDFAGFVLGLAQMALIQLGEVPAPGSETKARDLEQARQSIDLIDMLEVKTRGNLTPNEAQLVETLKSELKLKYVHAARST